MEEAGPYGETFREKLNRLFHIRSNETESEAMEQEIVSMINEGQEQGILQDLDARMITNIFEWSDKEAQDIMTRRSSVRAIDGTTTLKEAVKVMLHERCSRYPVYIENLDHIIGIVHLKDACRELEDDPSKSDLMLKSCKGLIREAIFIPETRSINNLFRSMQAKKIHMVIVIDEYGQTAGIVAMEDILEEIVGNIFDEYDEEDASILKRGQDSYEIDGLMSLEDLGEKIDVDFSDEHFDTLSGLMISHLGRIPKDGQSVEMDYGKYHFKALNVKDKVVRKVLVTQNKEKEEKSI